MRLCGLQALCWAGSGGFKIGEIVDTVNSKNYDKWNKLSKTNTIRQALTKSTPNKVSGRRLAGLFAWRKSLERPRSTTGVEYMLACWACLVLNSVHKNIC